MVCYGYLRVSTVKQEEANFKSAILNLANDKELGKVIWISETVSGRKDWRKRELGKYFEKMNSGDTIVMGEFSRIGRDFMQSMMFIDECRKKNIKVYSTIGDIPMNNDATSNLLLAMSAWKSQVERENIAYRTKIGIAAAKERGSILGRKRQMVLDKDPNNVDKIKELVEKGIRLNHMAKELKISRSTLYKFIKLHHIKEKPI